MKKLSIILLLAVFCGHLGMAQVSVSANSRKRVYTIKGDYYFDHNNFVTAINNYSKSLNQNPKDLHTMLRMAEANEKLGNYDLANQWYSKAFSLHRDIHETYILKYISLLHKTENYDALRHWVTIYNERVSGKTAVTGKIHNDSLLVLIHNLRTINSSGSDLGPAFHNDQLFFSSDRVVGDEIKPRLYSSVMNTKGELEVPIFFPVDITSQLSAGPVSIAQKPGKLFFTARGESQGDQNALMEVFLFDLPATPSDKIKMDKLVIKNFDHGMGHPAVNNEGTLMFFTSNNPKTDRGFDLYRTEYNGKNWSTPKALGSHINTTGDEMYPTLCNDSILYFASNGHGGLGGLDIYKVNIHSKHAKAEHLKSPVNSPSDDFGLIFSNHSLEGYVVSNRPGGLGGDDLYKFYFLPVKTEKPEAVAEDKSKPEELSLYTSTGNEIKLTDHDALGNLAFEFIPGMSYTLIMDYENHKTGTIKPNSTKTALPKRNAYTFEIQKLSRSVDEQKEKGAMVKDIHINPGDLVTFQLIPNGKASDAESSNSKIHFNKDEAVIRLGDTIVFSYVAEAGPETPSTEDNQPVADLNATKEEVSADEKVANTTYPNEGNLTKNTQPGNIVNDMEALQNKETIAQDQSVMKGENPATTTTHGENAGKPIQQNTQENIHQMTDPIELPDSVDRKNVVAANNDRAKYASQFPSANAVTLQNQEAIQQSQVVGMDNNPEANARTETATQQTKTQNADPFPDGHVFSDSADAINVTVKNNSPEEVSELQADGMAPENKAQVRQNQTDQVDKIADTTAVSKDIAKTFQQNKPEDITQTSDSNQASDPQKKNLVLTKIAEAKDESQFLTNVPASQPKELTEHVRLVGENKVAPNVVSENNDKKPAFTADEYLAHSNGENNDFEYRVQIAAAKSALSDVQLKKIYHGAEEIHFFREDGYYKYIIEVTPNYPEAQQALQKSGVDHAFISAYKGYTKWNLKEAIALQKEVRMVQMETDREDKNTDHAAMTRESVETPLQENKLNNENPVSGHVKTEDSKTDPAQPIAAHSLTGSDKNTNLENISNNISEKDPASTINQVDATSMTKDIRPSGSADARTPEKNNQPDFISEFSRDVIALPTKATSIDQRPVVHTVEDKATGKNKIKTDQQNKPEDTNRIPGDYQLSASLDSSYVFTDTERQRDLSQFSSDRAMPVDNKAAIEQNQPDRKNKNTDLGVVTGSAPDPGAPLLSTAHSNQTPVSRENNKFEYRVQIAASKSKMNDAQLKNIYSGPKEIHRFKEDGYYKYTIEETPSYPDAQRVLKESGVDHAFITAYKGDSKWNLKEAITFQNGEPEQPPRVLPATGGQLRPDDAHEQNDFRYRVQIAASKRKIKEAQLKKEYSGPEEILFFKEDGYYKYYIEETPNYYVARKTLRECKVDSAFISVYKGNIKWPLQDAIALQYKTLPVQSDLDETDSVVTIVTVNFELDEFVLLPIERSHLREHVVDVLKNNSNYHAIVNGYTDIRGSESYNFGLSQERAHFVEQLIIDEGINAESVTTQYFGESQVIKFCPENEHCDESVHQVNRRVEILLLMKKKNPRDIQSLTNLHQ